MRHCSIRLGMVWMSRALLSAAVFTAEPHVSAGAPRATAFTYQGVLTQDGTPANGTYHLRFQLWNALTDGAQIGTDVDHAALVLSNGRFSADLDFGSGAINGDARWLQVQVITGGGATVTTLSPRQPLNAAPYALHALGVGTIPDASLVGAYTNALSLSNRDNDLAGNGADITGLNASNMTSGTLAMDRLPVGGDWSLTSSLDIDAGTLHVEPVAGRVGIGTPSPLTTAHIVHDNGVPGHGLSIANSNSLRWSLYVSGNSDLWLNVGTANRGQFDDVSGSYTAVSDQRLKTGIQPLDSALDGLMKLEPKRYRFTHQPDDGRAYLGLLAQDVKAHFPEVVHVHDTRADGGELADLHTIAYSDLVPVLIRAIQEQQRIIDELRAQQARDRDDLRERLQRLEARMTSAPVADR